MPLYQSSVLNKYLATQEAEQVALAYKKYASYFLNKEIQENIRNSKEEQFQEGFLRELFVNVLGYTINPNPDFNLTTELKNIKDAKKTDGAILSPAGGGGNSAIAVIELKGTDTKDLSKVNDQAFNYKNNQPDCVYVITSNFEKLRFFIHNAVEHEEFNLFTLTEERFKLLWLFLQKDNLLGGIPAKVKEESLLQEEKITKALYADYSAFKNDLWEDMVAQNPQHDPLLLYQKSQKLLDRFLFIFFAEDKGLLPPNSISSIVDQWQKLKELDEYKPLYSRYKKYFGYMNDGYKGAKYEIHAYNGGLFKADELLDSLLINDVVLEKHCLKLTNYDFADEVDTNILGHIFEHSLNDIENVRAQLAGEEVDKSKTKRKKDGVFYTPKYITKYIVDNTVGKLCQEKKAEIGIDDEEFAKDRKGRKKATIVKLDTQLKQYRTWLLQLTICDPACGSGAFLNQALEFLMAEHRYVDELEAQLFEGSIVFQDVENHILENNIYGVDINEESVEIARLSLWLRTAQKGRKLTSLSSNIKCGNSLIDDPEVAGDLAFNWQEQFPKVFAKGGFDVVIGNPPYVRQELIIPFKPHLEKTFETYQSSADLFVYFIEMSVDKLINTNGIYSIIVANKWMRANYGLPLRKWMSSKNIIELIDFGDLPVFENVAAYPCILSLDSAERKGSFKAATLSTLDFPSLDGYIKSEAITVDQDSLDENGWSLVSNEVASLVKRLKSVGTPLKKYIQNKMFVGLKTGYNAAFIIDEKTHEAFLKSDSRSSEILRPYTVGRDIHKYGEPIIDKYLICVPSKWTNAQYQFENEAEAWTWFKSNFSSVAGHLELHEENCRKRSDQGEYWWELRACEYYGEFEKPKIIYSEIATEGRFSLDAKKLYCDMTAFIIGNDSKYLLSILNSKLFTFLFKHTSSEIRGGFLRWKRQYLYPLPIPACSDTSEIEKSVDSLLTLSLNLQTATLSFLQHLQSKFDLPKPSTKLKNWPSLDFKGFLAELKKAKVPQLSLEDEAQWMEYFNKKKAEANALQTEIDRIDKEIDLMVYALYGLTEEEIQIVENS